MEGNHTATKGRMTLTTEHARSSYGQPVLICDNGQAYGPDDLLEPMFGVRTTAGAVVHNTTIHTGGSEGPTPEWLELAEAYLRTWSGRVNDQGGHVRDHYVPSVND